jgi:eukaryotic-like serine/threonine-protein kinase
LTADGALWETSRVWEASAATLPLDPSDPSAVGPYRIAGRLGGGGMGTVYLAHAADGRAVALKVIRPELAGDPGFRARFAAELEAARRVTASCTARVVDADLTAAGPWIATEYVEGPPLDRLVAERGPLPPSGVEALAVGVAAALTAIHAAGLVHRDLKPANVLVSPLGPKVIDFGIARDSALPGGLTMPGTVFGTPGWMAPEQLAGAPAGPAADVFAWGALVAFAASGRPPFGTGPAEVLAQRNAIGRPDLRGISEPLLGLVAAAMDAEPGRRPSARALLLALLGDQALADPDAAATEVLERTWVAPAAPGWSAPPAGPGPAAPAGLAAGGWGRPPPLQPARGQRPRRPWYRRKRFLLPLVACVLLLLGALADGAGRDHGPPARTAGGSGGASSSGSGGAAAAGLGRPVRDGKLELVVGRFSCGHATVGREIPRRTAHGQFCLAALRVRNIGRQPWRLPMGSQFLYDRAGRQYRADQQAWIALGRQSLWEEINPGLVVSGTLVFDLPRDVRPARLVLHDSAFSRGATVTLRAG